MLKKNENDESKIFIKNSFCMNLLLESFEEITLSSSYKHRLKQKGLNYKKEIEEFIDKSFRNVDKKTSTVITEKYLEFSKEFDELYNKFFNETFS